jgi:hypothetical protein
MSDPLLDAVLAVLSGAKPRQAAGGGTRTRRVAITHSSTSYERSVRLAALRSMRAPRKPRAPSPRDLSRLGRPELYSLPGDEFAKFSTSADEYFFTERVRRNIVRIDVEDQTLVNGVPAEAWRDAAVLDARRGAQPSEDVLCALGVDLDDDDVRAALNLEYGPDEDSMVHDVERMGSLDGALLLDAEDEPLTEDARHLEMEVPADAE